MNELTNGGCGGLKPTRLASPAKTPRQEGLVPRRALARLNYKKRTACRAQSHEVLTRGARLCTYITSLHLYSQAQPDGRANIGAINRGLGE